MLGLCSASALLQTRYRFRSLELTGQLHGSQGSHMGWYVCSSVRHIPSCFTTITSLLIICLFPISESFFYLIYIISDFHSCLLLGASISTPTGWCLSPGLCTTNLAAMFLYSHHLVLPHNCLSACVSAWYDCLRASLHILHFYGSYVTLEWSIFGLCAVTSQPVDVPGFAASRSVSMTVGYPPPPIYKACKHFTLLTSEPCSALFTLPVEAWDQWKCSFSHLFYVSTIAHSAASGHYWMQT